MKKRTVTLSLFLAAALFLTSCSLIDPAGTPGGAEADTANTPTVTAETIPDFTDPGKAATGDFSLTGGVGAAIEQNGSVYTIKSAGEFTLTGALDGQIIVDAGDDEEVRLILKNAALTCSDSAPILILNASEATVNAADGSYNTVTDARTGNAEAEEESEENYDAAIYSACDLKLTGKGTLIVESSYDNGVKSKDDVSVKNVSLKVTAPGNAIKGNDSVTVKSGNLILISTSSDGVKTANSDVSAKGNQRGNISFLGGHTDIYAAADGVSAACDVIVNEDEAVCVLSVYTASYSDKVNEAAGTSDLYLILPRTLYSQKNDYYAYFYTAEENGVWVPCVYETMIYSGRTAAYYGLLVKAPADRENVIFAVLPSGTAPDGSNHSAATKGEKVNTSMNGYVISSISGSEISGDWVRLNSGSGSSAKTAYSSKGIKAQNDITVSAGRVTVFAMDDGLHANAGESLENGKKSTGSITVTGGTLTVTCADDGLHADGDLTVSGGEITVAQSHEGLEGNVITIGGGTVTVYASDDGLNAFKGSKTALINITGGYLDVTTSSGDTDGIDSNGSFTMSGGTVLVKGGSSSGRVSGSVDVDGTVTVTGGTIIALGGICETPSGGSVNTYASSGTAFSAGEYALTGPDGEIFSFSLSASYSSVWIASDRLTLNQSYTLSRDGTALLSWTQSSQSVGSAGAGGMGGFGGNPGGMGGPGRR